MKLTFEWDEIKSTTNLQKHKVSFEEGKTIFNDPFLVTFPDDEHSANEDRFVNIGVTANGLILVLTHTERQDKIRNISCRKVTARGKYYKAYRAGHKVVILKEDGTTSVQYFKLEDSLFDSFQ